jgi:hypothetical protein
MAAPRQATVEVVTGAEFAQQPAAGAADPAAGSSTPSSRTIVGQLASGERLRVVAALALGARTPAQISELARLTPEQTAAALTRLLRAGLVATEGGTLILRESVFAQAARAEATKSPVDDFGAADPAVSKVLRTYLARGRLTSIPVSGRKRKIVMEYLAAAFVPGLRYSEAQVNAILRSWHEDVAALRRYLVEENLLSREAGQYWRSGGWVDVL